MKEAQIRLILPLVVFFSLCVVACATILRSSRTTFATPAAFFTTRANIIPQKPPIALSDVTVPQAPCLATSPQFVGLRECNKQSDCAPCTESPTSCVVVGDRGDVNADGTLSHPVSVNVALPPSGEACGGHGTQGADGVCECDGVWNEDGSCASDVCFKGSQCEVGVFNVNTAGRYCLPSYLGACDEFTSDTVLSNVGAGTTWSCRCKQSMAGLFVQEVEGGNCNTQVACGAPVGVNAQVNVGSLSDPVFEEGVVYPNRLTSFMDDREACVYKTGQSQTRTLSPLFGPNVPDPQSTVFVEGAAADADPTCVPRLYSNKCTITTGGGNTQVIRGSGLPGDPHVTRVSPPFFTPVPPGMNRCPDGWSGRGTEEDPCTNPDNPNKYAFFTEDDEWIGPTITSVAQLREWWVNNDEAGGPWATLENGDVFCLETGMVGSAFGTDSAFCVDDACSASEGTRAPAWVGVRDGPLLNDVALPHWVSGGPYGGQCTCDGRYDGGEGHAQVAAYALTDDVTTPDTWWSCAPDMCPGTRFPDAYWNQEKRVCECNTTTSTRVPPFFTGMHYKHPTTPAVCVQDPCNPSGVNVSVNEVTCNTDAQCGGVCSDSDNRCYIPFADSKSCESDIQCTGALSGMSNRVAKCVEGTCATLDVARARMGSTCTEDSHCSLGACTGPAGGPKTCTGGCACSSGHHQVSDGGASPLGLTCADDCIGKCLNGGMCVHLSEEKGGGTECVCTPYFGGDRCETKLCARHMEYCDDATPCCSECPCGGLTECCNVFPLEPTPDGGPITCLNNTCQEYDPGTLQYPLGRSDVWFNSCYVDGNLEKDELLLQCADGETTPNPYRDDIDVKKTIWHTSTPAPCNGWGYLDENDKCVCFPRREGDTCETSVCALQYEACTTDTDCCNHCFCESLDSNCCPDGFDPSTAPTSCIDGTCVPAVEPLPKWKCRGDDNQCLPDPDKS